VKAVANENICTDTYRGMKVLMIISPPQCYTVLTDTFPLFLVFDPAGKGSHGDGMPLPSELERMAPR